MDRKTYHTLDGMRGVAAVAIVFWHAIFMFGWRPASGYLAVDLFFVLSGFVIAHAYDDRLAKGLGVLSFMRLRLIRLWPLYLLGLAVVSAAIVASFVAKVPTNWTPKSLAVATVLSAFYIPMPASSAEAGLFPLNFPAWSLTLELLINLIFVLFWRKFTTRILVAIVFISAVLVAITSLRFGSLNIGYLWGNAVGGVPRVFFGFFAGVSLARLNGRLPNIRIPAWIMLVLTFLLLAVNPGEMRMAYDTVAALILSPLLVYFGSRTEPSRRIVSLFSFLGVTSYAVYTLHIPAIGIVRVVAGKVFGPALPTPWIGAAFLAGLLFACVLADRYYDVPVRKFVGKLNFKKSATGMQCDETGAKKLPERV